jgi:general secretion pathway protein K
LSLEARSSIRISQNTASTAAARAAADAGIQRAILDLVAVPTTPSDIRKFQLAGIRSTLSDSDKFRTDGSVNKWQFATSTVSISVRDEVGKINLNTAPEALLAKLFKAVGADADKAQSLAHAVADYRDADNFKHRDGAEENEYRAARLAWGPKNAPFQGVEELQQVLGMTGDLYKRASRYLTLYSMQGRFDPATSMGMVKDIVGNDLQYVASYPDRVYAIRAEANRRGAVFIREATVQIIPEGRVPRILSWR